MDRTAAETVRAALRSGVVHDDDTRPVPGTARVRRRDRHGRGLRGVLAPAGVPLRRSRAQQFDDLVLQAVGRLETRWEAHLAGVEFAVEEIPPASSGSGVALARLEPGGAADQGATGGRRTAQEGAPKARASPPRIVVYRRPLMIRAEDDEELADLVFDVVVEEFARLLGIDPSDVDPGYAPGE